MKNLIILLFLLFSYSQSKAQASWNTRFAFVLYNEENEKIDFNEFIAEYKIADVMGSIVPQELLKDRLTYDEKSGCFILDIETIGPRFSFALYHNNTFMAIYFPFNHEDIYYVVDLKFRSGTFLFDFNTENKEKLLLNGSIPYYKIDNINWRKQQRNFVKSNYASNIIYKITPE